MWHILTIQIILFHFLLILCDIGILDKMKNKTNISVYCIYQLEVFVYCMIQDITALYAPWIWIRYFIIPLQICSVIKLVVNWRDGKIPLINNPTTQNPKSITFCEWNSLIWNKIVQSVSHLSCDNLWRVGELTPNHDLCSH